MVCDCVASQGREDGCVFEWKGVGAGDWGLLLSFTAANR